MARLETWSESGNPALARLQLLPESIDLKIPL